MPNTEQISDLEDCRSALEEARAGKLVPLPTSTRGGFARMGCLEYDRVRIALQEAGRGTSEGSIKESESVAQAAGERAR